MYSTLFRGLNALLENVGRLGKIKFAYESPRKMKKRLWWRGCVRTTNFSEPPVTINVTVDKEAKTVSNRIKTISCSCPAGSSKEHVCKHAMAVLLELEK